MSKEMYLNAEMYYSSFPNGRVFEDPQSQNLFYQDMRRSNFEVPTLDKERQLFEDIKVKREIYNQSSKDNKDKLLESLNDSRKSAAEHYLRFVVWVARNYYYDSGLSIPELTNAGTTGLMQAINRFVIGGEARFHTYAFYWVRKGMQKEIAQSVYNEKEWFLRLKEAMLSVESELTQELYREPTEQEVADRLRINVRRLKVIKRREINRQKISLEREERGLEDEGEKIIWYKDTIEDKQQDYYPEEITMNAILRSKLEKILAPLTENERRAVELRFDLNGKQTGGKTVVEIAKIMGLRHQRISQLLNKALPKIRSYAEAEHLYEFLLAV